MSFYESTNLVLNTGCGLFKKSRRLLLTFICLALLANAQAIAQSGAAGSRPSGRQYGVNLTFAVYQYDPARSPAMEEITRLAGTFSTAEEEIAHLKEKSRVEDLAVRHIRSVGLRNAESFNDAVLLGPEYMTFVVTARDVMRGFMRLDMKVRYANEPLLDVKGVEFENFETVILRGGRGMFGVKFFIGAGGRRESAPIERALLVSVTPEIVPVTSLRNRPEQLSHPVDEYGAPLAMSESDRFTPPVAMERVAPRFETGRPVTGSVLVSGVVTPDGRIINLRVLRSLDPVIDDRAVAAFRQYKFSPALLNGKPVHATYREEIVFASDRPAETESEQEQEKKKQKKP